jgi:hypothetical protein
VLSEFVEQAKAARLPALILDALNAAEFNACPSKGFVARYTGADEVLDVGFKMKSDFVGHPGFKPIAAEESVDERTQASEQLHRRVS